MCTLDLLHYFLLIMATTFTEAFRKKIKSTNLVFKWASEQLHRIPEHRLAQFAVLASELLEQLVSEQSQKQQNHNNNGNNSENYAPRRNLCLVRYGVDGLFYFGQVGLTLLQGRQGCCDDTLGSVVLDHSGTCHIIDLITIIQPIIISSVKILSI